MSLRQERLRTLLQVDLAHGTLKANDGAAMLALPPSALQALLAHCPESALVALGRALGEGLGNSARSTVEHVDSTSPEDGLAALGAHLASHGLGSVALERWGDALVLLWRGFPLTGNGASTVLTECASTMVTTFTGALTGAVELESSGAGHRLLLASEATCKAVRSALSAGTPWGQLLARLAPAGAHA